MEELFEVIKPYLLELIGSLGVILTIILNKTKDNEQIKKIKEKRLLKLRKKANKDIEKLKTETNEIEKLEKELK